MQISVYKTAYPSARLFPYPSSERLRYNITPVFTVITVDIIPHFVHFVNRQKHLTSLIITAFVRVLYEFATLFRKLKGCC
jgi:hypothetical protein